VYISCDSYLACAALYVKTNVLLFSRLPHILFILPSVRKYLTLDNFLMQTVPLCKFLYLLGSNPRLANLSFKVKIKHPRPTNSFSKSDSYLNTGIISEVLTSDYSVYTCPTGYNDFNNLVMQTL
jgi:hypothetical protein